MLTTLKLALAAAIAATGGYALQNTPQSQPSESKATWTLASATDAPATKQDDRLSKRVSVKLEGTVADVAKWLTEQGVSFVISDQDLAQKRVLINLVDQPLKDAVDAIAEALGGKWNRKGDVYVFRSSDPMAFAADGKYLRWDPQNPPKLDSKTFMMPRIEGVPLAPKDGKVFEWKGKEGFSFAIPPIEMKELKVVEGHQLSEAQRKEVEAAMKKAHEAMKKAGEEMKSIDVRVFGDGDLKELKSLKNLHGKPMTDAEKKEFERAMKELDQHMSKVRVFTEKEMGGLKELKELKNLKNLHGKPMTDAEKKHFEQAMKELDQHMSKMKVLTEKELGGLKELKELKSLKELHNLKELKVAKPFVFESGQIGKLMKSLTPAQKELHKKKGFLTPQDLTAEQRKMIPPMSGDWNLTFSIDGEKLTLKGK